MNPNNYNWLSLPWNYWVGNALIILGVAAIILGVIGILRFKPFTMKVLASTKIDTVAFILIIFGVVFRAGLSWFSLKALFLLLIVLYLAPIVAGQTLSRARQDGED